MLPAVWLFSWYARYDILKNSSFGSLRTPFVFPLPVC